MNIIFTGWRKNEPWDVNCIQSAFSTFLGLHPHLDMSDFHCWTDVSGTFLLSCLHTSSRYTGPRRYFKSDRSFAAAYTGFPVILEPTEPGKVLLEADKIAQECKRLEDYGEGRFAGFWFDKNGLHILTDPFGLQQVFQVVGEGVAAWSTSMNLMQDILSLKNLRPSAQAVAEYASKAYLGGGVSLIEQCPLVPGGTHLRIDREGHVERRRYYHFPEACMVRQERAPDYEKLTDDLLRIGYGLGEADLPYRAGITGGHDSRLIAGLLHKANVNVTLFSEGGQGHPDFDIGKQVAAYLGLSWEGSEMKKEEEKDWESAVAFVTRSAEGYCNLLYAVMTVLTYRDPDGTLPVVIVGSGGETARSGLMTAREYFRVVIGKSAIDEFIRFRISGADELLTEEGRQLAREGTYRRFTAYRELGLRKHELLAANYVEDRMTGWAAGMLRCGDNFGDAFCPFMIRSFQETAVHLDTLQQLQEALHFRLTKIMDPSLLKIPFLKPYPPQSKAIYLLKLAYDQLFQRVDRATDASYKPLAYLDPVHSLEIHRKQWFRPLLEGSAPSNLWNIVEYERLKKWIEDDSAAEFRRRHYKNLYGVLTLWATFHFRNHPVRYRKQTVLQ
jgi:hypothetical protein